ncbi:unnamed protein product [Heligmosomoides polygyrus]|uniref:Reverse transcriptase domain-containing protein n=1 Tax=Heligmosomoides polygyrus TaxID=6339 RepID=A0A3P7YVL6_HELPZ|nr:unnamed protein product [Heligmosomoides polygyrus]
MDRFMAATYAPPRGATGTSSLCELGQSRTLDCRRLALVTRRPTKTHVTSHGVCQLTYSGTASASADAQSRSPASVETAAGTSAEFPISVEVHETSALSPLLYDDRQKLVSLTLLYADDRFGLRLNVKKTEYLTTDVTEPSSIMANGIELPRNSVFKHLRSAVASELMVEVNSRNRRSIGSDVWCWPATKEVKARLSVMETKMLRWTAGVTRTDRIRNKAIRQRYCVVLIADKMREARLRWYGHLLRGKKDNVRKIGLNFEVSGKRPRGHPKQCWSDTLHMDLNVAGVHPDLALNRERWRHDIRVADPATMRDRVKKKKKKIILFLLSLYIFFLFYVNLSEFTSKRPVLEVPTFSGDCKELNAFWSVFQALIHNDASLTDQEKFLFLKQALKGEAAGSVTYVPVIEDNYCIAVNILKKQYDRSASIADILICEIEKSRVLTLRSKAKATPAQGVIWGADHESDIRFSNFG